MTKLKNALAVIGSVLLVLALFGILPALAWYDDTHAIVTIEHESTVGEIVNVDVDDHDRWTVKVGDETFHYWGYKVPVGTPVKIDFSVTVRKCPIFGTIRHTDSIYVSELSEDSS